MKKRAMPKKKAHRDLERVYPKGQFIAKLRRLADTLEAGKSFTIQIAGERLFIPKTAVVNIEHEREGGWEEVEFQVKWPVGKEAVQAKTRRSTGKTKGRPRGSAKKGGSRGQKKSLPRGKGRSSLPRTR